MIQLLKRLWNSLWKISDDNVVVEQKHLDYPEVFFRGVQNTTDVDTNYYLKSSAFLFGSQIRPEDGMKELSIVWNDCDEALQLLLEQKNKNGTGYQFEPGYATVELSRFTNTVFTQLKDGLVSYERRPIIEDQSHDIIANPYHGNILLHESASDQMKKNIQHTLATLATFTKR